MDHCFIFFTTCKPLTYTWSTKFGRYDQHETLYLYCISQFITALCHVRCESSYITEAQSCILLRPYFLPFLDHHVMDLAQPSPSRVMKYCWLCGMARYSAPRLLAFLNQQYPMHVWVPCLIPWVESSIRILQTVYVQPLQGTFDHPWLKVIAVSTPHCSVQEVISAVLLLRLVLALDIMVSTLLVFLSHHKVHIHP